MARHFVNACLEIHGDIHINGREKDSRTLTTGILRSQYNGATSSTGKGFYQQEQYL